MLIIVLSMKILSCINISYVDVVFSILEDNVQAFSFHISIIFYSFLGQSNPYCEVSMGSQEHKTKVIPNTLNPRWNASMQFLVKNLQEDVLCISVFDRDLFSPNGMYLLLLHSYIME